MKIEEVKNGLKYIESCIDIENRRLFLSGEVDLPLIDELIRAVQVLEDINKELPIHFYISSPGGLVYNGLALFDILTLSPCPVITHVIGSAFSMAFILALAGDERCAYPNARLMFHEVSGGNLGKVSEQEIELEENKALNEILINILGDRTKKNVKYWRENIKYRDTYMDAYTAKKLGVIHKIVGEE